MKREILVIGGGPAGIEAARAAASAGAQVSLISDGPLGGRAGWHSLVPSKVWLAAADALGSIEQAESLGLRGTGEPQVEPAAILRRIRQVSEAWNRQQAVELQELGVRIIQGEASFIESNSILVQNSQDGSTTEYSAEAVILTAGSVPIFPEGLKPDGKRVLAPRFAGHLEQLPEDIIVIGAGATGTEFAYLFNRLGVRVTWIIDPFGVLPGFDPAAGEFVSNVLKSRGVELVTGHIAEKIERHPEHVTVQTADGRQYNAAIAFVGIGRRGDLSRLNLSAAGLTPGQGGAIAVDEYGRTEAPGIYAAGDVTGTPMLANQATTLARTAGLHAAEAAVPAFRPELVVKAVYSQPQVAEVGALSTDDPAIERVRLPYSASLKAHLLPDTQGFVELAYDRQSRKVAGALAVGDHAADLLAPLAVALHFGATLEDLAGLAPAHPTLGELLFMAARKAAQSE